MTVVLGGSGAFPQFSITTSMTWTPPMSGNVCIHVIGAGGGGAGSAAYQNSGGAGGGYSKYNSLAVTPANNLTIVIGVGGVGSAGTSGTGADGGNSTVSWTSPSSVTLTANGGDKGQNTNTLPLGGTASGGDVNNTGGDTPLGTSSGGSVGIFGTGRDGSTSKGGTFTTLPDSLGSGLAMSQFGVIVGGQGTPGVRQTSSTVLTGVQWSNDALDGGDLQGGAACSVTSGGYIKAGDGGFGGGGGSAYGSSYQYGGHGGNGLVLIQYLPW